SMGYHMFHPVSIHYRFSHFRSCFDPPIFNLVSDQDDLLNEKNLKEKDNNKEEVGYTKNLEKEALGETIQSKVMGITLSNTLLETYYLYCLYYFRYLSYLTL
ncbi:hypothetical protein ACJX0J_039910, partial [Zea mays]